MTQQTPEFPAPAAQHPQHGEPQERITGIGHPDAPRVVVDGQPAAPPVGVVGRLVKTISLVHEDAVHGDGGRPGSLSLLAGQADVADVVLRRIRAGIALHPEAVQPQGERQRKQLAAVPRHEAVGLTAFLQMDIALLPPQKRNQGSPQNDQEGAMKQQQRHAPPQAHPDASHQGQHGQHAPKQGKPDGMIHVRPGKDRATGLPDKRRHSQHDHQGHVNEKNDTFHQKGAYTGLSCAFTAMHSISINQPGRQTAAWTKTLGVCGKRASYRSFTTS